MTVEPQRSSLRSIEPIPGTEVRPLENYSRTGCIAGAALLPATRNPWRVFGCWTLVALAALLLNAGLEAELCTRTHARRPAGPGPQRAVTSLIAQHRQTRKQVARWLVFVECRFVRPTGCLWASFAWLAAGLAGASGSVGEGDVEVGVG